MHIKSAILKLYKQKTSRDKYNSDFILNHKEKETFIISAFIIMFILVIPTLVIAIINY